MTDESASVRQLMDECVRINGIEMIQFKKEWQADYFV